MKHKKKFAGMLLAICSIAAFGFIRLDDDPIKKIVTQLGKWIDVDPQEKVYIQTDKPYYAAGDDIWLKAYVTIGPKHQLSALSNILNVELINEKDSIKTSIKLPVNAGIAWGDFALPDTLQAGNYRIRAYTNYMRNAGEEYFFDKTFYIGNSVSNNVFTKTEYQYTTQNGKPKINATITYIDLHGVPYALKDVSYQVQLNFRNIAKGKGITDVNGVLHISFDNNMPGMLKAGKIITNLKIAEGKTSTQTLPIKAASNKIDVQFFPEGGNLVTGVRSKVAFKATGPDGLGTIIKGVIKDNSDAEVAQIETRHFGMGYFALTPESGKTYKAVVTFPDGSVNTIALPAAVENGHTLTVINTDPEKIIVRVGSNPAQANQGQTSELSLIAQQNGVVCYAAKSSLNTATFSAAIPKNRFPTGIVQFTLFSSTGEPLNERIIFVQNPDLLKLNISTDKQIYGAREKVKINLNVKDGIDKPAIGSFSAAVINESKVPVNESDETTILSSILLSSDIKGYIEKPNYYFTNINDETQANLDLLMMTQGYRRFVWKQILNDVFPAQAFKPEKSINITGTIKSGKKPVPNGKITLFTTQGGTFILDTVADAEGHFAFNNLIFKDSIRFVIQARTAKGKKDVDIDLDNIAGPVVTSNKNAPDLQVSINNVMQNYLLNSKNRYLEEVKYGIGNHITMLKEVVIAEKKKPEIENSTNLNGAGNADQIIKSDAFSSCPTLSMCLAGRLMGVLFKAGVPYSTRSQNTPMYIVLDGMPLDAEYLDDLNPSDIEAVEVLRTAAYTSMYGINGGGGVLVITTKRGGTDNAYIRYAPGIITYAPKGYYKAREFYSPEYDNPKTNAKMADLRTTIFWKPNIVTDKDGNASFEYFNADGKGTYRVVVEGIDGNGNLGRQVYRYKVE